MLSGMIWLHFECQHDGKVVELSILMGSNWGLVNWLLAIGCFTALLSWTCGLEV